MIQFYFLSILLNLLAGCILISENDKDVLELNLSLVNGLNLKNETLKLVVGILSVLTGLLKILSPIEGDIPIVGDIFIAVTGLASGFILIFEYYKNSRTVENTENTEKINRLLISNKKIIGIAAIVAAALHFIFPRVLLL